MADAFSTPTTAAQYIPEVWSNYIQVARESTLRMANLVRRLDFDVASFGDTIHVPNVSNLVAGDISVADGSLDATVNTDTLTDILIDKWKGVTINNVDIVTAQSKYDLFRLFGDRIAYALGLVVEQDLLNLATAFSQTTGTFNTALLDAPIRDAVQALDDARVPFTDRHFMVSPATKNNLLNIDKFIRYDAISFPKGQSPILNGNVGEVYGVRVHVTPEVPKTVNDTSNLMFHRDAIILAMQKKPKMEKFARTAFTQRMGGSELYGFVEARDDHGVEVRT